MARMDGSLANSHLGINQGRKNCARGYPKSKVANKTQTWHGSDRQCRGLIVQALRNNSSLTEREIKKLWPDDSQVEKALNSLSIDGLIEQATKVRYSLP